MSLIEERIIEQIHKEGPLRFDDFMEMALYDPANGYYTSPGEKTGSKGDYYTSPYLGSIFGAMIGKQVEEMWRILNEQSFVIVEYGAGNGALCHDILCYLKNNIQLYDNLSYYIIEKSPVMREKEKNILAGFTGKVKWISSINEIAGITGCVLSNEVVDNFPVHQVVMQDELMEVFVDHTDTFVELLRPASEELKDYLHRLNVQLFPGFRTEINLEAEKWIKEIAGTLQKGFVITIDYGYTSAEMYRQQRHSGTLLCYYKHTINDDPFKHIGEQDITAHVNFSALRQAGVKEGLAYCGFTSQSYFLLALGLADYLRKWEHNVGNRGISGECNVSSLFTLLIRLGQKIKVLIQKKGQDTVFLSGMRFATQIV